MNLLLIDAREQDHGNTAIAITGVVLTANDAYRTTITPASFQSRSEMDGERDHVHLLVAYPLKLAVSVMVNNLKSVSSRLLRQQNPHLRMQSKTGLLWSRSYFACSAGGATIETLKAYVLSQNTPE